MHQKSCQLRRILARFLWAFCFVLVGLGSGSVLHAQEPPRDSQRTERAFAPYLGVGTDFPLLLSARAGVLGWDRIELSGSFGITPSMYASLIGSTIDRLAGTSGYANVLKGALDSNSTWGVQANYRFRGKTGWLAGAAFHRLSSTGSAGISEVETVTGTTFPGLRAILNAAGRALTFSTDFSVSVLEVHGGYAWQIDSGWFVQTQFGVAKLLSPAMRLSSSAPTFDASAAGRNLYNSAQASLDDALSKYGYSPFLTAHLAYYF